MEHVFRLEKTAEFWLSMTPSSSLETSPSESEKQIKTPAFQCVEKDRMADAVTEEMLIQIEFCLIQDRAAHCQSHEKLGCILKK